MKKKNIKAELKYQLRWLKGMVEDDEYDKDSKVLFAIKAEIIQLKWILNKCFKK